MLCCVKVPNGGKRENTQHVNTTLQNEPKKVERADSIVLNAFCGVLGGR